MSNYLPRPYSTPVNNSLLLPLLLLSLSKERNSPKQATRIKTEYDYVIVGAGSGGSVVASRLSEIPCINVLLLEAGPSPSILSDVPAFFGEAANTEIDWGYRSTPQKHTGRGLINRQVFYPRGKTLGGSSVLNAMLYIRGNRRNYDYWAEQGAVGWSYEDVLPYFKKAEDNRNADIVDKGYHGVGGPLTVERIRYLSESKIPLIQSATQAGYRVVDVNGKVQTGINDPQLTARNGQRCSTAKAYLVPAENRTNLDILPNAMVRKIVIENKRAVGVLFDLDGETYEVRSNREVILSAGSINSPQILMLSGIGPREELEKFKIKVEADLPVGLNLQDHVGTSVDYVLGPKIPNRLEKLQDSTNILQYIYNRTGPLASNLNLIEAFLSADIHPENDFPEFKLEFYETTTSNLLNRFNLRQEVYDQVYGPYENKPLISCFAFALLPKSRGKVTLKSSNPYDPPLINPNYFDDPHDVYVTVDGMKACDRIAFGKSMKTVGLQPLRTLYPGCERFADEEDRYLRCQARTSVSTFYHPIGTAKMGNRKDPTTVVDPTLRVKYIQGLRVVDASIMPTMISGNTNAPVIMIAEKASDLIKETITCEEDYGNYEYDDAS